MVRPATRAWLAQLKDTHNQIALMIEKGSWFYFRCKRSLQFTPSGVT